MEDSRLKISQDWCSVITQITLSYQQQLINQRNENSQKNLVKEAELAFINRKQAVESRLKADA